ncbi:hypothetical protein [Jannaschia aquimarina]|uniref:Pilus assembly protein n=1 Tax=Jannaschia aquimarina TaxID=935700 RepID=A0A0D1D3K9_9RHOB|nr:hypothetical protein [Jannaschia aquimarina]KIT14698.1 hypothetical protein jaqu_36400 [Jannaschia aquimarina]SNT38302.1 hypothetical protein SAMN05421775_113128 [Jannaschia aquimarina]
MSIATAKTFFNDETGAVTVDWVVLTAALVGLGLAVMGVVQTGVGDLTGDIGAQLGKDHMVQTQFDAAANAILGGAETQTPTEVTP